MGIATEDVAVVVLIGMPPHVACHRNSVEEDSVLHSHCLSLWLPLPSSTRTTKTTEISLSHLDVVLRMEISLADLNREECNHRHSTGELEATRNHRAEVSFVQLTVRNDVPRGW